MKKFIYLSIILLITSCSFENKANNITTTTNIKTGSTIQNNTKIINTNKKITENINKTKLENKKQKYATRWLIISWTIHLKNDEYILALKKFFEAYKNKKWDDEIEKRIADTYYLMKKWDKAYEYYDKIEDNKIIYKDKYIKSFLYSLNIYKLKHNKTYLSGAINKIKSINLLNDQEKFFYSNSLSCINDFSLCKKNFQDYLEQNKDNITAKQLKDIQNALNNYKNFKIDELYFKNTLILWAFFKNDLYPIVIILWKDILKEKPNYKPVLKMIAQSYFELWDYENAKEYLTKYYALDSNDKDVLYLLAIISQKTHDFILSTIYLNKAENLWYKPQDNIYRLQIYNYYVLDNSAKILENFDKLISSQKKPLYNDLVLATYYNLINWNTDSWEKYAKLWLKLYPKFEDFYGFEWWILIEKNKLDEAKNFLEKWYKINKNNALINLNLGRIEEKKWNFIKAKLYYKKAIKLDNWWEISKISVKMLENLEKQQNTSSWQTSTWIIN